MRRGRDGAGHHHRTRLREAAISIPPNLKRNVGLKLSIIARHMRKGFDKSAGELGVTRSQSGLMAVVVRHPGATQRIIAEALEMSEASAGRLIDRLCADGLLERRPKEDDRRAHAIFLTDKAQPLLEKLGAIGQVHEAKTFDGLTDDELLQFAALLERIYGNLTGHPQAAP